MYDFHSTLFYYRFIFFSELILCQFIFCRCLKRKSKFWLRFSICFLISIGFILALPIPFYNWAYTSFIFFFIYLLTLGSMFFLFKESPMVLLFCSISGYSTQHIAFQMYSIINYATSPSEGPNINIYGDQIGNTKIETTIINIFIYILILFFVIFLVWLLFARKLNEKQGISIHHTVPVLLALVLIIASIILNSVTTYNSYEHYSKVDSIVSSSLSLIICILSLAIFYMDTHQKDLEEQLDTANHIIHEEEKQYQQSKENIELINLKCHDLKHQIRKITENKIDKNEIDEITDAIKFYDSKVKSGNSVLDVVLTEKAFLCNSNDISLTCLIDGSKLSFMEERDLYSIFGNAFDNAIEASKDLPNSKRVISLTSKTNNNIYVITMKNYTNVEPIFVDNLPQTTKSDKNYHGYGMKSIKRAVEKYNGHLNCFYSKNIFTLSIFFDLNDINLISK